MSDPLIFVLFVGLNLLVETPVAYWTSGKLSAWLTPSVKVEVAFVLSFLCWAGVDAVLFAVNQAVTQPHPQPINFSGAFLILLAVAHVLAYLWRRRRAPVRVTQ